VLLVDIGIHSLPSALGPAAADTVAVLAFLPAATGISALPTVARIGLEVDALAPVDIAADRSERAGTFPVLAYLEGTACVRATPAAVEVRYDIPAAWHRI